MNDIKLTNEEAKRLKRMEYLLDVNHKWHKIFWAIFLISILIMLALDTYFKVIYEKYIYIVLLPPLALSFFGINFTYLYGLIKRHKYADFIDELKDKSKYQK